MRWVFIEESKEREDIMNNTFILPIRSDPIELEFQWDEMPLRWDKN